MTREGRLSLFRGTELHRLVILAVFLLVCLPGVYYLGYANANRETPRPLPIASLPPLPPADTSPELAAIEDITRPVESELEARAFLLKRVRDTSPEALHKIARTEILPINLLKNPKRYRGLPIHFEGYANQVFAVDDIPKDVSPSGRLYEVWIRTLDHDQRIYPMALLMEDVPKTLAGGRDLSENVSFDGYFLKLNNYKAGDGVRFAPVLIGRLTHTPGVVRERSSYWILYTVGILVIPYVFFRIVSVILKFTRPKPRRNWFPSETASMEPQALDAWLKDPEVPPEE